MISFKQIYDLFLISYSVNKFFFWISFCSYGHRTNVANADILTVIWTCPMLKICRYKDNFTNTHLSSVICVCYCYCWLLVWLQITSIVRRWGNESLKINSYTDYILLIRAYIIYIYTYEIIVYVKLVASRQCVD